VQKSFTQKISIEQQKLAVLVIIGLFYSLSVAYFFQTLPRARLTSDLFPRWHASRMLLTSGRSIYDWENANEVSAVTGWSKLHQLGYYYPAYMLIFTAPLAWLPYGAAHIIWVMLGLWFLWLSIFIFARLTAPNLSLNHLTLLLGLVTTAIPIFQHTLYAQFNSIGALSLALTYWALCRRRYLLAGLLAAGLLFKPQATIVPLFFILAYALFRRERWLVWLGLGFAGALLWGVAELLERNWVANFLGTLSSYERVQPVVDILRVNPFQLVSLILLGATAGFIFYRRHAAPESPAFYGMLAFTLCLNSLIVPMFGMLHIVLMGPVLVILLGGYLTCYPAVARWLWWGMVMLFVAGLLAFILPLLLTETTGFQINSAEIIYRFTLPIALLILSLPLVINSRSAPVATPAVGTGIS
jgi:hypothetical protein